jgi:hypothetical protein
VQFWTKLDYVPCVKVLFANGKCSLHRPSMQDRPIHRASTPRGGYPEIHLYYVLNIPYEYKILAKI